DQLHPAVAVGHLLGDHLRQPLRLLEVDGEAPQIALRPGQVPPGPDDPGQVGPALQPAGVERGTAVADEEHAGVALHDRLLLRLGQVGDRTARPDADVAVRVDQAGQDPHVGGDGAGPGHLSERDPAVGDPDVPPDSVGQHDTGEVQRRQRRRHRHAPLEINSEGQFSSVFFGSFSLPGSNPGGRSFMPPPSFDRSGIPPGMPPGSPPGMPPGSPPGIPGKPRTLGWVGPFFLPFLPFLPLRVLLTRLTPRPNPPAICCIILRASKNRLTRSLTSRTCTPDPRAMRSRRDALMILGLARSSGVMPRMMACTRSRCLSSIAASWSFICPAPGSMLSRLAIGPILRTASICSRKSSSVSSPADILAAASSAFCWSNAFSACSIRVSTSPMPRMRDAIRSGWKTSKSSSFSPLEANRIGWPVTSRTLS